MTVNPLIYLPLFFALQFKALHVYQVVVPWPYSASSSKVHRRHHGWEVRWRSDPESWGHVGREQPTSTTYLLSLHGIGPNRCYREPSQAEGNWYVFENQVAPCISFWLHWIGPVLQVVYVLPYLGYTILETQNSTSGGVYQFSSFESQHLNVGQTLPLSHTPPLTMPF